MEKEKKRVRKNILKETDRHGKNKRLSHKLFLTFPLNIIKCQQDTEKRMEEAKNVYRQKQVACIQQTLRRGFTTCDAILLEHLPVVIWF